MTSTITTKLRTAIVALLAALSLAVAGAPAADAMPRDCDRLQADYSVFQSLGDTEWGRWLQTGSYQARDSALGFYSDAQSVSIAAGRRGCDWA